MHWLLHLLVDAVLVATLAAAYCAYQEHRRRQSEYARVQLYEDADKPCVPAPFSRTRLSAWQQHLQHAPLPPAAKRLATAPDQPRSLPAAGRAARVT